MNTDLDEIKETRRLNLESLVLKNETIASFARKYQLDPTYISQLLNRHRSIGETSARNLEKKIGLEKLWLDQNHADQPPFLKELPAPGLESNVSDGPAVRGKVPLIAWVQAGQENEAIDLLHPGMGYDWIDVTCPVRTYTYALRVEGDSMAPDFPPGTLIVVEPELDPLPGDFVIIKNGSDEVTFKQLVKDGGDWYLKPLNDRYPIKPLGASKVIGVVRESVRRFR